ncbi:MAG TPA: M13 family metallopeptidase [Bacteroidia bacterium]|nr:M13 family metallopeptidase [Bacteroidia bacterium]
MKRKLFVALTVVGALAFTLAMKQAVDNQKPIDPGNFNDKVRAQDDFFEYVNGSWIRNNPIPATEVNWGNFSVLNEKSLSALRSICEEAAKSTNPAGSNAQMIGDFFAAGMDSVSIEKMKFGSLAPELKMINDLKDKKGVTRLLAQLHRQQVSPAFGLYVMADMKNSNVNAVYVFPSGMGLPEKSYYLGADMAALREKYREHVKNMFILMGDDAAVAQKNADAVLKIETALADSSLSAVEQRDQERQYNKMTIAALGTLCPSVDWKNYCQQLGAPAFGELIVSNPAYMKQVNHLMITESLDAWKAYYRWHLVHSVAPKMHEAVTAENFNFYGMVLTGAKKQQPRWKRVLSATEGALGEALGQEYVKKNFSAESKKRVNIMVDNLIEAYKVRIKSRTWMSEETKTAALAKLDRIIRKLGYPDKWRDYKGLQVDRKSYVRNYFRSNQFDVAWNLGKLSKPVDKEEWGMSPSTVNAYYNPSYNEIVFPAAIMQPPFFNPDADDAVNYGAMGAVIGHELTHGFDDQGAMFDAEGNMKNWWTQADMKNFSERTKMLSNQFSVYVAIDSLNLHVNGDLTLGENIADLGGLTIAYYAYKRSLEGKPAPAKIDGFSGEQRFFISWAQGWRNSQRPNALINMVKTNPHSPAKFRVLGPLSNMPEFYTAFEVKEGDKMYRKQEERIEIW